MLTPLFFERFGPMIIALSSVLIWRLCDGEVGSYYAKELFAAALAAASIGAGFLTTSLSILLPMGATAVGKRLKKRGKLKFLFSYLRAAIFGCLGLSIICVICFFQLKIDAPLARTPALLFIFGCAYATAALIRLMVILIAIFTSLSSEEDCEG